MRYLINFLVVFLISVISYSQNYQTIEEIDDACAQLLGFSSNDDAEIAVDRILEQIGIVSRIFELRNCPNINNAAAINITDANGYMKKYILYDLAFMNRISNNSGTDWAAISVLAHEIGHHILDHSLNNTGSNHKFELEADYWSGWALSKLGATLEQAQSAVMALRYTKATRTHPAKADRILAIAKGWKKSGGSNNNIIENKLVEKYEDLLGIGLLVNDLNAEKGKYLYGDYSLYINRIGKKIKDDSKIYEKNIPDFNFNEFTISCDFKTLENNKQWVFMLSSTYRLMGYALNNENNILLTANNQTLIKNTNKKIKPHNWYKATITFQKGKIKMFLDQALIHEENFEFNRKEFDINDRIVSMANYSNGIAFKGFIRNFKVYDRALSHDEITVLNIIDKK